MAGGNKKPKKPPTTPPIPIPRRSYYDNKEDELTELKRRFGGTDKDWVVDEDGYWVVVKGRG